MLLGPLPVANLLSSGEMGRRIADINWSNHPLGPIETWSQSLKTTIHIMLNSRHPMWMGWGTEFYFFCNDAHLATAGIKESWVLGAPAREVWAESWPDIRPRAESVVQTGQAASDESLLLFLERSGHIEETYYTFAYSPIPGDSGTIGGILCILTEVTERIVGERRLAILHELSGDLTGINGEGQLFDAVRRRLGAHARDLPFSLVYLFDEDVRHARLASAEGANAGDPIAPSMIDVTDGECVWPARRILADSAPIIVENLPARVKPIPAGPWPVPPHTAMLVPIAWPGRERPAGFLIAGISPYRPFDTGYRGLIQLLASQIGAGLSSARAYDKRAGALADLEAELSLGSNAEERQKFVSLVENSQDFIAMASLDGRIIYLNAAGRALAGVGSADDAAQTSIHDYLPVEMQQRFHAMILPAVMRYGRWEGEIDFQHLRSGAALPMLQTVFLVRRADDDAPLCLATVARDISAQKQASAELRNSEERYRTLVEGLPAAVYACDAQGRITLYNEAAVALWGRKPAIGKDAWCGSVKIYRPDGTPLPLDQCPMAVALKHGRAVKGEEIIIERPNGTRRHVIAHPQPLFDARGAVAGAINMLVDITERKIAEDALRASEERLRMATQAGTLGVWDWDIVRNRVTWSESLYPIHGLKPGEFGGTVEAFAALVHPDDRQFVSSGIRAALKDGTPFELEFRILRPDGQTVWIFTSAKTISENSRATRMIGATVDISQRKAAEAELQHRHQTIQLLSETLAQLLRANDPDSIVKNLFDKVAAYIGADSYFHFMVDAEGGALELHSYSGVSAETAKTMARLDFDRTICGAAVATHQTVTLNDIQKSDDDKAALMRGLGLETYTCNPLMVGDHQFGTLAFASHTRKRFNDDELEFLTIVSQYTAIALDRLRAARALRHSEDQLAAELTAMQQLHAMTTRLMAARDIREALDEVLDAVIAIQGADFGKVRIYNPDRKGLEVVAQRGFNQDFIDRFWIVTPEDDFAAGLAMRTKTRVVIDDVESHPDYATGRSVAALAGYRAVQATPLISRSGDLLGMLLTHFRRPRRPTDRELRIVDLYARQAADFIELLHTKQELHESEERLRRQADELEQQLIASGRLVSLGEITASMAHEFNNPLGIILGFAEDLMKSTPAGDAIHRPLQIINDEARRCKRIIQDLMDYARPRATNLSPTKIDDVVSKTLSLVENRLYKQKIKLKTEIAPELPRVRADYQQLEQVLVNFYLNAIDAMPRGGELSVSAEARHTDRDQSVVLTISDTGIGIEEEALPRIFQPFYTAKKTRGMGLGLPICQRIVKNHGGRIEVESRVGEGTTFKIVLPLIRENL